MDKTPKICENFSTHKPQSGLENIPFLNGHHSPADRARELFLEPLIKFLAFLVQRFCLKKQKNVSKTKIILLSSLKCFLNENVFVSTKCMFVSEKLSFLFAN